MDKVCLNITDPLMLWPSGSGVQFRDLLSDISVMRVEQRLNDLYPSGFSVLTTSGRSALGLSLQVLDLNRSDFVQTFPFASKCVLDTISNFATPTRYDDSSKDDVIIAYHQWGFLSESFPRGRAIIEDCVDTLCEPSTELFPAGGDFEIWSAPKIYGLNFGGVLWCKHHTDYLKAKSLQKVKKHSYFNLLIRQLGKHSDKIHDIWQALEKNQSEPGKIIAAEISRGLDQIENLISGKKRLIEVANKNLDLDIKVTNGRLPAVIPLSFNSNIEKIKKAGLDKYVRHYTNKKNSDNSYQKVISLPIHHQMELENILKIINLIK